MYSILQPTSVVIQLQFLWDEWDNTALQTQNAKFEPWWFEAEHATSVVTEAPHNIESLCVSGEKTFCFFETWMSERGSNPRFPTFQAAAWTCTRTPTLYATSDWRGKCNRHAVAHSGKSI